MVCTSSRSTTAESLVPRRTRSGAPVFTTCSNAAESNRTKTQEPTAPNSGVDNWGRAPAMAEWEARPSDLREIARLSRLGMSRRAAADHSDLPAPPH